MLTLDRHWKSAAARPPKNNPVEIRFSDGSSDLALWTGETWFPLHRGKELIGWRPLPDGKDEDRVA